MKTYSPGLHVVRMAMWRARAAHYLLEHNLERRLIARNADLKGRHAGERCFILGNGPSLADEQLAGLAGETVITVNNLTARSVGAPSPAYHVISDRRFFSLDPNVGDDREVFDALWDAISGDPSEGRRTPCTFVPSSEHGFFSNHAQRRRHDIRYFCNPFYFSDYYGMATNLTGVVPRFSSVIQHAVIIALAMGFDRIYLLGCDATNIVANVRTALAESTADSYAYPVTPGLDAWFQRQYAKRNMERCAESFLEVLVAFRFLAAYCQRRGVELVNCSPRTVVDSIQCRRLQDVLCD